MPIKVKINQDAIASNISDDGIKTTEPQMAVIARNTFNARKNLFLKAFDNHRITKEIEAGPGEPSSLFDWGSLFAFIGFEKTSKPIEDLRFFFQNSFSPPLLGVGRGKFRKVSKYKVNYITYGSRPGLREIAKETKRPWDNVGSWALELETGTLPYFSQFLPGNFDNVETSRSGRGLQKKKPFRDDPYQAPPEGYLRVLLKQFDDRF